MNSHLQPSEWPARLARWKEQYGCKVYPPALEESIAVAEAKLSGMPLKLREFYSHCNGLVLGWFEVLPVEHKPDIKGTWNSILRANDIARTQFLGGDPALLTRFMVFARLDADNCAVIDRNNSSIWYQEEGELHQVDLSLEDFIETVLKEVRDL